MNEALQAMIQATGPDQALTWWLQHGMNWPGDESRQYCTEAIDAMARDDVDFVITDVDGSALARAFQWVDLFGLQPFVEARRVAASA
jgi:hypothetical protein